MSNLGTVRVRHIPQEGKDTNVQTIVDAEGYKFHLAPNETKVLADTGHNVAQAANATVKWGSSTAQASAPHVEADIRGIVGRT